MGCRGNRLSADAVEHSLEAPEEWQALQDSCEGLRGVMLECLRARDIPADSPPASLCWAVQVNTTGLRVAVAGGEHDATWVDQYEGTGRLTVPCEELGEDVFGYRGERVGRGPVCRRAALLPLHEPQDGADRPVAGGAQGGLLVRPPAAEPGRAAEQLSGLTRRGPRPAPNLRTSPSGAGPRAPARSSPAPRPRPVRRQ